MWRWRSTLTTGVGRDICYLVPSHANAAGILARRTRVECRGFLYHVITPGNQGQKIFTDDQVRARQVVCYAGRRYTELSVKLLAEILRVDPTCVSRSVARVEGQLAKEKQLKRTVENITTALENGKYQA